NRPTAFCLAFASLRLDVTRVPFPVSARVVHAVGHYRDNWPQACTQEHGTYYSRNRRRRLGGVQFELPADATAEEVACIESLVPRIETGLLELRDPGTGEVVFSCRPSLTGESLLKTATRSAVTLRH